MALAGSAMMDLDLVRTARPILEDLAERTNETVNLAVRSGEVVATPSVSGPALLMRPVELPRIPRITVDAGTAVWHRRGYVERRRTTGPEALDRPAAADRGLAPEETT